jgi:fatty-acyl-CoA synthase
MPATDSMTTGTPPEQRTIGGHLRTIAQLDPDREALIAPEQEYRASYGELFEQTGLAARGLIAAGVGRGDRVAIWASDRYESIVLGLAAARTGASVVAIDPGCDAGELGDALGASAARLLAMSRGCLGADHGELLGQVRERCPQLGCVVTLDGEWHAFLEEGAHVSECELVAREASLTPGDEVCFRPVALTHAELLAGVERAVRAPMLGALTVILRGACVSVPSHAPH